MKVRAVDLVGFKPFRIEIDISSLEDKAALENLISLGRHHSAYSDAHQIGEQLLKALAR